MTKFIESFTTRHMLPPWKTTQSRCWLFVASVPCDRIRDYLEDFMNSCGPDKAHFEYEVWTDPCFGFLTLVEHYDFTSEKWEEDKKELSLSHTELIWTFPAARYRRTKDNLLVEKTLVWLQPFYFDDSSYVTFSSREIYGGEKGMADILIAEGSTAREFHMDVDLHGFSTYNPRSHVHAIGGVHIRGGPLVPDHPLTKAQEKAAKKAEKKADKQARKDAGRDQSASSEPAPDTEDKGPDLRALDALIAGDEELRCFMESFASVLPDDWSIKAPTTNFKMPQIEINSVKQYRDANSFNLAAYRAIVASQVTHAHTTGFDYLPGNRVDVRFMWSDSFKAQLGNLFGLEEPSPDEAVWGHVGEGLHIDDKGVDWKLQAVKLDVRLAMHFFSDAHFAVAKVLHAYGDSPFYSDNKPEE